ncbi:hypothetical protein Cgig2_021244 [Carnegiea gigantea]|uniref:Uncharacterized protein n=1 Tax=Carnegiea gigantea TaxID=171969 RepID=A0A9Q1KWC3_9CARY|nr:hypothetical protein Cgig2_021244 [Carnegiea gigantea]
MAASGHVHRTVIMSKLNIVHIFALVFTLVLCYNIILAEGRVMKCESIVQASDKEVEISNHYKGDTILSKFLGGTKELKLNVGHKRILEDDSGDFQPASLERNPGAGRGYRFTEDSRDFGPTAPGRSPGAGHKHQLVQDSGDFRPTSPRGSPGTSHDQRLLVEDSGDFRPTAPGRSPGAGHGLASGLIEESN